MFPKILHTQKHHIFWGITESFLQRGDGNGCKWLLLKFSVRTIIPNFFRGNCPWGILGTKLAINGDAKLLLTNRRLNTCEWTLHSVLSLLFPMWVWIMNCEKHCVVNFLSQTWYDIDSWKTPAAPLPTPSFGIFRSIVKILNTDPWSHF